MYKSPVLTLGLLLVAGRLTCPPVSAAAFPAVLVPNDLGGTSGFIVQGKDYEQFGLHVAGIGDVNADGWDDIISGDNGLQWYPDCYCEATPGMAYVIFGGPSVAGDGIWSVGDLDGTNGFGVRALQMEDYTGYVSAGGDFNDDDVRDFLVGAPESSLGGWYGGGACFLIYGNTDVGSGGSLDLASLNGQNGFAIYGSTYQHAIGAWMASIGDFNGDGADDIALGSPWVSPGGRLHAGQCYILLGGRSVGVTGTFQMSERNPQNSITINGIAAGDSVGASVDGAGDVNGDGRPDIIIGSGHDEAPGEAYVVFGGPDVASNGVIELSSLDGTNGFIIRLAEGTRVGGQPVVGPGDINGDGYDDVAVFDIQRGGNYWVDVVFGGPDVAPLGVIESASLNGTNGFQIIDEEGSSAIGTPSSVGDLNHDGLADIAVMRGTDRYVVFGHPRVGSDRGRVDIDILSGGDGFKFDTPASQYRSDGAGDVNGDGIDDWMISGRFEPHFYVAADWGQVFVIFGRRQSGDADGDGDLDLADFLYWTLCMLGPGGGPYVPGCEVFDFDRDGHVDLRDFAGVQDVFGE